MKKLKIDPEQDVAKILELHSPGFSRRRKLYIALAILIILTVAAAIIYRTTGKAAVTQYKTKIVGRGNLTSIVTATGTLQPTNTVSVGSELSGIINSVEVNYNDRVKAGQDLAMLDTSKLEAQITQSRAALESAKAKVLQSQATVEETRAKLAQLHKVRELSNGKVPSQAEMDAAEAAFGRANADLASATSAVSQVEAALLANETDLSKSVIRSPINGIVLTRSIEPGQTVAASFQAPVLFTLAEDLTQMELHVNVDEADVGKVRQGQTAEFSVSAYPNRTFNARITQVRFGSSTTSGVVTYETVLKVNNQDLSLRPGMTATADITVKQVENALLIPGAALRFTPPVQQAAESSGNLLGRLLPRPPRQQQQQQNNGTGKERQTVWLLMNGQLSPVFITVGAANGGMTEVIAGDIQPGMEIVVDVMTGGK